MTPEQKASESWSRYLKKREECGMPLIVDNYELQRMFEGAWLLGRLAGLRAALECEPKPGGWSHTPACTTWRERIAALAGEEKA